MLLTCEIVDDFRISRGQSWKKIEMAELCHPLDLCLQCSTRSLRHSTFLTQLFPQMTTVLGLKSRDWAGKDWFGLDNNIKIFSWPLSLLFWYFLIVFHDTWSFPSFLKGTNEFDGMVGQLINQEVFMAAAALTIIADRQLYVNFSKPFDMQPYTFMYKRPTELTKEMMFVDPFTPMVRFTALYYRLGQCDQYWPQTCE